MKSNYQIIKNYRLYKRQFSKKLCSGGTEEKFWEIYKDYKGNRVNKTRLRRHDHHFASHEQEQNKNGDNQKKEMGEEKAEREEKGKDEK